MIKNYKIFSYETRRSHTFSGDSGSAPAGERAENSAEFYGVPLKMCGEKEFRNSNHKNNGCYIALISILIISAVILVISIGVSLRSIEETNMGLSEQQSLRALALANLCGERALMKLESVLSYAGGEDISVGSDICSILAISGTGNFNRVINAVSTVSGYTRKVSIVVYRISPTMQITSWREVSDF